MPPLLLALLLPLQEFVEAQAVEKAIAEQQARAAALRRRKSQRRGLSQRVQIIETNHPYNVHSRAVSPDGRRSATQANPPALHILPSSSLASPLHSPSFAFMFPWHPHSFPSSPLHLPLAPPAQSPPSPQHPPLASPPHIPLALWRAPRRSSPSRRRPRRRRQRRPRCCPKALRAATAPPSSAVPAPAT